MALSPEPPTANDFMPPVRGDELRQSVGLFTEIDLMQMFNVSSHTLQYWRVNGSGPKFAKLGRGVFYRKVDVQNWINTNLRTYTPAGEASSDAQAA